MNHKKKTPSGLKVYGDWGAHDELAGEGELDERMALSQLAGLAKGKEYGADFDYYLMDAFWFEKTGQYGRFQKSTWPEGPGRFLAELRKAGMEFGLWFDVNMEKLKIPEGAVRRAGIGGGLCLGYEENMKLLFDGIRRQIQQCQCSMLKLDFAFFDCDDVRHSVHAKEKLRSKEPAIRNFIRELTALCRENTDLLVLGYNGFTTDLEGIAVINPKHTDMIISPWWCLYLDYVYCGDPRPAEFPTKNLGNSLLCYTDSMIGRFTEALIPYCAIDDHGTMIGNTNTIYYLGKESFRDSWIMNIARGGEKLHLYGELSLLEDEDWRFIGDSSALFEFVCRADTCTKRIGKSPEKGEVYGYSSSDGKCGYLTLVNPRDTEETALLKPKEWEGEVWIRKYYGREGFLQRAYEKAAEALPVSLRPFEVVVYEWKKAEREDVRMEGYLILEGKSSELLTLSFACSDLSIQFTDERFSPLRLMGRGEDTFRLECLNQNRGLKRLHAIPIWSGCSWLKYQMTGNFDGGEETVLRLYNDSERCLFIKWKSEVGDEY